jgi:hypothetical protein
MPDNGYAQVMIAIDDFSAKVELNRRQITELFGISYVPEPKRGGTFYYCQWRTEERHGKNVQIHNCEVPGSNHAPSRFRTKSAYRRHWRRNHS